MAVLVHRTRKRVGNVSEQQLNQAKTLAQDSSSDEDDGEAEIARVKHLTRNTDEAIKHYENIWTEQKKELVKPGMKWIANDIFVCI
jgi:hypothetical protein